MQNEFPELNYDKIIDNALLGVVRDTLRHVEKYGLPSNHYFYITIKTKFKGVSLPEFLLQKYPDNMTIVLQYEFSNLHVSDKEFGVTLSFNTRNYYIRIPFQSIMAFTDPGVNFSLQFNVPDIYGDDFIETEPQLPYTDIWEDENDDLIKIHPKNSDKIKSEQKQEDNKTTDELDKNNIISMDKFRK